MSDKFTLETLRNAVAIMKKHAIEPTVIRTKTEAKKATEYDSVFGLGRQWKIGDSYFTFPIPIGH